MSLENIREIFQLQGFVTGEGPVPFDLLAESERVFAAVKQFAEIEEMIGQWDSVQARLASEFYGPDRLQNEKLWDTYLILVCPGVTDMKPETAMKVDGILGNMAYCRKLILDAGVLADMERVRQNLSPLFPVTVKLEKRGFEPLDALRQKLRTQGLEESLLSLLDENELEQIVQRAKGGPPE